MLLADEFRSKVLEDALKLSSQTPDDFEWNPLQYVTSIDGQAEKSIRNLDQLRKMNQLEKENELIMECDNNESKTSEAIQDENEMVTDVNVSSFLSFFIRF